MAHFTLYSHAKGANGWSVVFVLKALGLSYETKYLDFGDFTNGEHKQEPYTKINPNGRIPALIDHQNGDSTVWESKACLLYLVSKYDTENKLGVANTPEEQATLAKWLFFQASGQAPYFGQGTFFMYIAPEKIPYAIERYKQEAKRVFGVLESVLADGREWLMAGKCTVADLANEAGIRHLLPDGSEKDFPHVFDWHKRTLALPYVAEALKEREAATQSE
uniref:FGENESH: predicted gene_14.146 protein n=1 Tax=Rhodotorula toruloides TaxID=5286 RepID=A0A0K3CQI4_RHOTO